MPHSDYDHATYDSSVKPEDRKACGRIHDMKIDLVDGTAHLLARPEWTDEAVMMRGLDRT